MKSKGEPIGQGGMGIVYRAYDTSTKRDVALKTLRGTVEPQALELFAKEWTVLANLSHPNIVDILDSGEFEDEGQKKPFFVMPSFPRGHTRWGFFSASGRFDVYQESSHLRVFAPHPDICLP